MATGFSPMSNPMFNASGKNMSLDPGLGLGDGDMLKEQAAQQILARRKKLVATPGMGTGGIMGEQAGAANLGLF
jgi:hypothetical protein